MKKIIKFIFGTVLSSFFLVVFLLVGFVGFSQTTSIPDPNFERKLIALGLDSGTVNGRVLTTNISSVTSLDVSNNFSTPDSDKIIDLTGIEAFTALTYLGCSNNRLTSLDVSTNTDLATLWCFSNELTSLDVSKNTALTFLNCSHNKLSTLDVLGATSLTELHCDGNLLTSLDVSANIALITLYCRNNQLTSLNARNGNNSNFIFLYSTTNQVAYSFNSTDNLGLKCIQVDDADYSTTNWTNKDTTAIFSTDCSAHTVITNIPDPNFEQALIDLGYDSGDIDGVVLTANISSITSLDVSNRGISSLTGIEDFSYLTRLYCEDNSLYTLDVSANRRLRALYCYNNQLTSLNVKNGNNTNFLKVSRSYDLSFNAIGNPRLKCIQVDSWSFSIAKWHRKDAIARFSENCTSDYKDIEIIYPKRNDFYVQGEDIRIQFNSIPTFTNVDFTLEYSIDNGATWNPTPNSNTLSNDEINNLQKFNWNSNIGITEPTSTLIKITANINGLSIEGISDEFIIQPSNYYESDGFKNDDTSKIDFPLLGWVGSETLGWYPTLGSTAHVCLDKYSQDFNYLTTDVECGKIIYAPFDGKIIYRTESYSGKTCGGNRIGLGAGIRITIQSDQDNTFALSVYHMESIKSKLKVGDTVIKGKTIIGKVGGSGLPDVHVHFSLYKNIYGWFPVPVTNPQTFTVIELLRLGKSFTRKYLINSCRSAENNFSAEFVFDDDNSNPYVYIGNIIINGSFDKLQFIKNKLISLAGDLTIKNASRKSNKSNEPITSLDGLETLRSIDGNLRISNTDITNLNGLMNLIFVGGDVIIENNNQLTDFCGLYKLIKNDGIGGNLIIDGNANNPTPNDILNNLNCGQTLTINEEIISHNLMLYPNPATNVIKINRSNINKIEVYSLNGMLLKTEVNKKQINIKNISKGIYFAKIFSGNKIDIIKFIKK